MSILFQKKASNKLLQDLNSQQRKAVTFEGGPLLILAGAGSGKTRVLTHRVAWFISEKKAAPENTLLLTFTNKSAGEMKQRIGKLTKHTPGFAAFVVSKDRNFGGDNSCDLPFYQHDWGGY